MARGAPPDLATAAQELQPGLIRVARVGRDQGHASAATAVVRESDGGTARRLMGRDLRLPSWHRNGIRTRVATLRGRRRVLTAARGLHEALLMRLHVHTKSRSAHRVSPSRWDDRWDGAASVSCPHATQLSARGQVAMQCSNRKERAQWPVGLDATAPGPSVERRPVARGSSDRADGYESVHDFFHNFFKNLSRLLIMMIYFRYKT